MDLLVQLLSDGYRVLAPSRAGNEFVLCSRLEICVMNSSEVAYFMKSWCVTGEILVISPLLVKAPEGENVKIGVNSLKNQRDAAKTEVLGKTERSKLAGRCRARRSCARGWSLGPALQLPRAPGEGVTLCPLFQVIFQQKRGQNPGTTSEHGVFCSVGRW